MKVFRLTNCAAALMVALTVTVAQAVTIDMVTVGNPGNAADGLRHVRPERQLA